ncbi:hypothetical protein J6590_033638 [Homalodisca vitripennis]|nr:hypothetical protein J6590_033638 [Homalodisca vitripennis]
MESPSEAQCKRRKVFYSTTNLKFEEAKNKRVRGETYTNSRNVQVPSKAFTAFDSFYGGQNKSLRDYFLASLLKKCESTKVNADQKKPRLHTWEYCVKDGGMSTKVCQKCILSLFKISVKRIRVIQRKLIENVEFQEKRGSHENRSHKLNGNVLNLMRMHLDIFTSDHTHYCGHKSKLRYFENPNLSIKTLFSLLQNYYHENNNEVLRLCYVKYFKMFKEHFRYGFQRPKTDLCDFCAEFKEKLERDPNDPCKVHLQVHERKFKRRKQLKDEYILKAKLAQTKPQITSF